MSIWPLTHSCTPHTPLVIILSCSDTSASPLRQGTGNALSSLELCPTNDFGGTSAIDVETVLDGVGIVTVAGTASSACQSNMARQAELQTN